MENTKLYEKKIVKCRKTIKVYRIILLALFALITAVIFLQRLITPTLYTACSVLLIAGIGIISLFMIKTFHRLDASWFDYHYSKEDN